MSTEPLFDITPDVGEPHRCEICETVKIGTVDQLRAAGWAAFDGVSLTDKTLSVRICPPCRKDNS